jgi:hypothetical protein
MKRKYGVKRGGKGGGRGGFRHCTSLALHYLSLNLIGPLKPIEAH